MPTDMPNEFVWMPEGGPPEGEKIRNTIRDLFRTEANGRGVACRLPCGPFLVLPAVSYLPLLLTTSPPCRTGPIGNSQKMAWLGYIVPEIEQAYEVQLYTYAPERLNRAIESIKNFAKTFHISSENLDRVLRDIYAINIPAGGANNTPNAVGGASGA